MTTICRFVFVFCSFEVNKCCELICVLFVISAAIKPHLPSLVSSQNEMNALLVIVTIFLPM